MTRTSDMFSLKDKVAMVTGSSRGLGRAIALAYAEVGADVVLVARGQEALEGVAGEIGKIGRKAWIFPFDLERVDEIPDFYKRVTEEVGHVDILANVAGMNYRDKAIDFPLDKWQAVLNLNTTAVFVLSQAFARACINRQHGGKIVNIASLLSEGARVTIPAYTASKGAIRQLTKALAVEWAPHGIYVNAIGPGYFETEITRPLKENKEFNEWMVGHTPLGRWGQPNDLGGAAVFLASPSSDYVTGHILYVDGGFLANL